MMIAMSCFLSVVGTVMSMRLAFKMETLDYPNEIKIHTSPTPTFGGLGILCGSLITSLLISYLRGYAFASMIPIFGGAFLGFIVGLIDDIKCLTPSWKLIGQICAGLVYVVLRLLASSNTPDSIRSVAFELCWVVLLTVGLSNSFNLFDGMDSILAGTTVIMAVAGSVIARSHASSTWSTIMLTIVGSCVGFLVFNLPPAKTFMGDCGSLYLGYLFGIAVYQLAFPLSRPTAHLFPWFLILALPICDTAFAIIRRLTHRSNILSGDRRHVYDMLCDCFSGNAKKTALVIWCVAALLSILGVWIDSVGSLWLSAMVVAAVYIALFSFGGYLGCLHVE